MRVVVCGGRGYSDKENVFHTLDMIKELALGDIDLATGDAKGADTLASLWAYDWNTNDNDSVAPSKIYRAEWGKYGDAAGPIRNSFMLEDFRPDIVVAFNGGTGTEDTIKKARAKGITVIIVGDEFPG